MVKQSEKLNPNGEEEYNKILHNLSSQVGVRQTQAPENMEELLTSSRKFIRDLGWTPDTDIKKTGDRLTDAVELQNRIEALRGQLHDEILELRRRSEKYVQFAEGAAKYLHEAEAFVEKHPTIFELLRMAMVRKQKKAS